VFSGTGEQGSSVCEANRLKQIGQQEHWFIDPADVLVLSKWKLGEGGFGTVLVGSFHGTLLQSKHPGLPELA